jgi:hypothetical protein
MELKDYELIDEVSVSSDTTVIQHNIYIEYEFCLILKGKSQLKFQSTEDLLMGLKCFSN